MVKSISTYHLYDLDYRMKCIFKRGAGGLTVLVDLKVPDSSIEYLLGLVEVKITSQYNDLIDYAFIATSKKNESAAHAMLTILDVTVGFFHVQYGNLHVSKPVTPSQLKEMEK